MKTTPNGWRYWLKEHQITAFWHGFGIANGLDVPAEAIDKRGERYHVSAEFMRAQLADYLKWLRQYKTRRFILERS